MDFEKGNIEASRERELRALKFDLEIYEQQLQDFNYLHKFDEIRKKKKKAEEEIKKLESSQHLPLNTLLLNGLENNISDLSRRLERERDLKKRGQLENQIAQLREALDARQENIETPNELDDAVDVIQSDQRLLDALEDGRIDEVDLYMFANSDMLAFMDDKFQGRIKIAMEQMLTSDLTRAAKGKQSEELSIEADEAWFSFKENSEEAIEMMKEKRDKALAKVPGADTAERQRLRQEIREYENSIRNIHAELQAGRSEWTHRYRTEHEIGATSSGFAEIMDPRTQEQFRRLITEAQAIRMERVQDYLGNGVVSLEKKLKEIKKQDIFSKETVQKLNTELAEARSIIVDQKVTDPAKMRMLAKNFKAATAALELSAHEVREARENRPTLEKQVQEDYAEVKSVLQKLSPEKIKSIKEQYVAELKKKGLSEDSKAVEKGLRGLDALAGDNVTIPVRDDETGEVTEEIQMHSAIAEFEARLNNTQEIPAEELLLLSQDLKTFKQRIDLLKNIDAKITEVLSPESADAKLAHQTIANLEKAKTPEDIQHILETNLGTEHLEFLSHKAFRKAHGNRTKGHMVFQEQGDKWKIIIDESVFSEEKALDHLKQQLTHELLHLEFEKSPQVRRQVQEAMIETHPEQWKSIREAFLDMAKTEGKQPPDAKEWTDDDILSELYAMQNEMGRTWTEDNTPKGQLNNLLTGLGAATAMGGIADKTRGYQEGAKETAEQIKERGYEEGFSTDIPEDAGRLSIGSSKGLTKEKALYETNKERMNHIRERIKEVRKSEFLSKVPGATDLVSAIDDFNEATEDLNREIRDSSESGIFESAVEERLNKMSGDLTMVEDRVGKAARKAPNTEMGLLRHMWVNTTFLCLEDFAQLGKDAFEFLSRRHKRRTADHAARLGMALFGGTDIGRESRARQQKAEAEEVNEWKSRYENLDAWQLQDELRGIANSLTPNQDQLKAVLRILASKGRLEWRDENLWKVLNKLQSSVMLKPGDPLLLHNPVLLRQRLHIALGEIYDYDEFTSLERDNESSYQSEKGKYDSLHSRMQDRLDDRMDELLVQHKAGETVDPILYESIMEYCIKNGKANAESVMFHLVAGMASGLLAPDRGLALGDHLNQWPAIDWCSTFSPPMSTEDWHQLCMDYFPDDYMRGSISAPGYGDNFTNFYWTTIQNNPRVIERVKKSVGERGWDHDWGRSIACLGDANTAKRFLSGRSGQEETKSTAVGNAYVGAVQWLEENARNPQFADKENFTRIAGWIAMSEGMLDGAAFKESSKDINTRANEAMNNDIPRESPMGNHGGKSLKTHRDLAKQFLMAIDPTFFNIILGREARTKEIKQEIGTAARDYLLRNYPAIADNIQDIEEIDQIFERLDMIIGAMFESINEQRFQGILDQVKANIG